MKLRKINQLTKNRNNIRKNNLYVRYQEQFDYFLNPDIGCKSINDVKNRFISYDKTKDSLKDILKERMDSVSVLIGYQGIGKSMDIRYSYGILNNAVKFDDESKTIIFPSFFNGFLIGQNSEETSWVVKEVRNDLTKRIASVCCALEDKYPELAEEFYSPEGKRKFYQFMKHTNPKAMVKLNSTERQSEEERIGTAETEESYIYIITQLKYYLTNEKCPYERIMIILDDVESLPYQYQEQLILQYLRFYTCMRNLPDIDMEIKRNIYVNLLISVRPATYKLLKKAEAVSAYSITREIYKTESVDMKKYFAKKKLCLPEKLKDEKEWNDAYNILVTLSDKFEKKYSDMIKNLVYLDIRKTLRIYKRILADSFWVCKEANVDKTQEEYIFNNITVIRALACGSDLVYMNNSDSLIPNIFYKTIDNEIPVLSLYVIAYFVMQKAEFWEYGENTVTKEELIRDFCDIFGHTDKIRKNISEIVDYLYGRGVISISKNSYHINKENELMDQTYLYLSSKGMELWRMLCADSVLMELYREDYYQDMDLAEPDDFSSSYDLMLVNRQTVIFEKIYKMLLELCSAEEKMIYECIENRAYDKYINLFGGSTMVEHLMTGVDKSIEYSGKNSSQLSAMQEELRYQIESIKRVNISGF
ncbi:hypothetical protein DW141_14300 [Ruminococcus sp. AM12-48]|jgi:hypothetical protein|nr:hypothetical protein DW648_18925 [Ruminococcus sp. AM23-1LB]RHO44469.1 hypothetical protein DW141_14300 [Ruminococcus sp. AM12-48]